MAKKYVETLNPATETVLAKYSYHSDTELENIIGEVQAAYTHWSALDIAKRSQHIARLGEVTLAQKDVLAQMITQEMGKPLEQAEAEIEKCALMCRYFAKHGADFLKEQVITHDSGQGLVHFQPLGIVLAVMPWNFPAWQVFRYAVPTLLAGNCTILKHASNVWGTAQLLESLFEEAEFPAPVMRVLFASHAQIDTLIAHPAVRGVTLTGSLRAGQHVAAQAAKHIKPSVLELGGSDPYIVLEDADIAKAAQICAKARLINSGQTCIAAKRFIVVASVYEAFKAAFLEAMAEADYGDPMQNPTLGPLARADLREQLHAQVSQSRERGADCLMGGSIPEGNGYFYPPTVLEHITADMPAYHEELFGPVATLIRASDEEDAIRIANDSMFGLGASVFTTDEARGIALARNRIEAGNVAVNSFVASHPALPFGGIKESGYGREQGAFGIRAFVNIKTILLSG